MTIWICGTCGVEHPDTDRPPAGDCAICADDRQWVPASGQVWTTLDELAAGRHEVVHRELEPALHGFNREPEFGIGQWTYLVQTLAATCCGTRRTTWTRRWSRRSRNWAAPR